jgi:8-oxo-dGTP diphosphatase
MEPAVMAVVEVVAGILADEGGRLLIAQRPVGKALAGRWEFPGGKLDAGETPYAALVRELREELGVEVHAARRLMRYAHDYPGRRVCLDVWTVHEWSGEPRGLDGQALRWVETGQLRVCDLLEADLPIVARLEQEHGARVAGSGSSRRPGSSRGE